MSSMIHVRVDERLKKKAERALKSMGLSMSDAFRVLLTRVAADQAFPLELRVPNAKTRAAMRELEDGGGKSFSTVAGLMEDLKND